MKTRPPSCPRCGYDLSGEVARWTDSCPLQGLCSECGLILEWKYAYGTGALTSWWHWEANGPRPIRSFLATFVNSLRPWRFWHEIRLDYPIRLGRLISFTVLLALAVHLTQVAIVLGNAGMTAYRLSRVGTSVPTVPGPMPILPGPAPPGSPLFGMGSSLARAALEAAINPYRTRSTLLSSPMLGYLNWPVVSPFGMSIGAGFGGHAPHAC